MKDKVEVKEVVDGQDILDSLGCGTYSVGNNLVKLSGWRGDKLRIERNPHADSYEGKAVVLSKDDLQTLGTLLDLSTAREKSQTADSEFAYSAKVLAGDKNEL